MVKWVKVVSDEQEKSVFRLCLLEDGTCAVLEYIGDYTWVPKIPYDPLCLEYYEPRRVTHWMPLPNPPSSEG